MNTPEDFSFEEIERLISEISVGERFVCVDGRRLLFVHPSVEVRIRSDILYESVLEDARSFGLPTIREMEDTIRSKGVYTDRDDQEIKTLQSKLEGQRAVLAKTVRVPARRERLEEIIADMERRIAEIRLKKEVRLSMTCERKAEEEKMAFLACHSTFDFDTGTKLWDDFDGFKSESNVAFQSKVVAEFVRYYTGISVKVIRRIARDNLWRIRYVTALKTGESLFGRSIKDYTVDQLNLIYWSHFYQSIYEMMPDDQPSEAIIDDDEALDVYMKEYFAEKSRERAVSKAGKKRVGRLSAFDKDEVLVTQANPMYQDIEYSETFAKKVRDTGVVDKREKKR